MSATRRKGLGKGLGALLGPAAHEHPTAPIPRTDEGHSEAPPAPARPGGPRLEILPLSAIDTNPYQPRQDFDDESMAELRDSIKQSGLIQPLVVRSKGSRHELIAGERRLRACKAAGLTEAPCIVSEATDEKSLVMALVENLQREDLNAIDEAEAFAQLKEDFKLSQEQVAERVGKSRVAVANSLRLLNLPASIQEDVRDNLITAGHARALLGIPDKSKQRQVWLQIKNRNLTVREAEDLCREMGVKRPTQTSALTGRGQRSKAGNADPHLRQLEEDLMGRLGSRVSIRATGSNRGRVELHYNSLDEFERILESLGMPQSERL